MRSLMLRLEELKVMLQGVDVFIGVETWLNDSVPVTKLNFPGFKVYRKDRVNSGGGGIIFIIRSNLAYTAIGNLKLPNDYLEMIGITITGLKESINIIALYRPSSKSQAPSNLSALDWDQILSNSLLNNKIILVGDFNSHNIAWNREINNYNDTRLNLYSY